MYFNEAQIQRMIEKFPPEMKGKFDKVVLKEITTSGKRSVPEDIVSEAIKKDDFVFRGSENNVVKFHFSFESLDCYNQPSESQFKTVLKEIEEELSKTFDRIVEARIKAISFGEEPDDTPPLYWGERDSTAEYSMLIKIYLNTPLSSL